MRYSLFLTIVALLFMGCNKKAVKYNPDFEGTWRTDPVYDSLLQDVVASELVIQSKDGVYNGTCRDTCAERLCDCIANQAGIPVVNSSKTELKVGSSSSYSLTIDQEPSQNASGIWSMKIEGLTYFKQ